MKNIKKIIGIILIITMPVYIDVLIDVPLKLSLHDLMCMILFSYAALGLAVGLGLFIGWLID